MDLVEQDITTDAAIEDEDHELVDAAVASLTRAEIALESLQSAYNRLQNQRAVSRNDAATIRTLCTGMESIEAHFQRYPVNSYTNVPSTTNLEVTLEGLLGTITTAVVNTIKAIWNAIVASVKALFGARNRNAMMVEKVQTQLSADLKVLNKLDKVETKVERYADFSSLKVMVDALPPFGAWMLNPSLYQEGEVFDSPALFIRSLQAQEAAFVENVGSHLTNIERYLEELEKNYRANKDFSAGEIIADHLEGMRKRPSVKLGYFAKPRFAEDTDHGFGAKMKSVHQQVMAFLDGMEPKEYDLVRDYKSETDVKGLIKSIELVSAISDKTTFLKPNAYVALDARLRAVNKLTISVVNYLHKTPDRNVVEIIQAISLDVRALIDAMQLLESIVNRYRTCILRYGQITRMYRKLTGL